MKIAALVHFSIPFRNCGSETVLHLMLKALIDDGHEVKCWVTDCPGEQRTIYEGVELIPVKNVMIGATQMRRWRPDVCISHHQNSATNCKYARSFGAKSVYLTHNDMDVNAMPFKFKPDLVIHNSEWVKESLSRYSITGKQVVIHPPLDCERHHVDQTGDSLTLINVNAHKGGAIFYDLAAQMPDKKFVGVLGGHGVQVKPPKLPNLRMVSHTPDLKPVWRQTRLLLMPSIYESYGLTGIEAGCSSIPTLAHATPGLRESLGAAGMFVMERENLNEWEAAIRSLDDANEYTQASRRAKENSDRLCVQTSHDMGRFVESIKELAATPQTVPTRR